MITFAFMILVYLLYPQSRDRQPTQLRDQPKYEVLKGCRAKICGPYSQQCWNITPNREYDNSDLLQAGILQNAGTIEVDMGCELNIKTGQNDWQKISPGMTTCSESTCKDLVAIELKATPLILATQLKEKIQTPNEIVLVYEGKKSTNKKIDVTLISQFSVNRLDTFAQVIENWKGPISIAIYLTQSTDINEMIQYFKVPSQLQLYSDVTITFIKPNYEDQGHLAYPINHLRNMAIVGSDTEYIFVIDADFMPSSGVYSYIRKQLVPYVIYQQVSHTAWVVPCFAIREGFTQLPIPNSYDELRRLVGKDIAYITDPGAGHGPTLAVEVAMVRPLLLGNPLAYEVCYESQWEPYYVLHRSAPLYDARFKNQGGDKQSHALQLNAEGYRFMVLREIFMVHKDHQSTLSWPGGGFEKTQKLKAWSYFDEYMKEIKAIYGSNPRWPRGCSAMALGWQDQRRDTMGFAAGAV
ncbi:glycosyl-transferase for dystroglycan-domain-containing protein [Sporodiniella umbellata]|nr:glycosyl-transferase for dystroglycan-domain-containing protein [Sporodiniella umbellata]